MATAKDAPKRPPRNRSQLLFEFDMQRDATQQTRQYFIGNAYPPCSSSLDDLEVINLSDLTLDTHHRGKVLLVRTADEGIRAAAIQTIVEDATGDVERLAVYNMHALDEAADLLRKDEVFAIKEPFFEANATGSFCIRVDHPSDIVWLISGDPGIPEAFGENSAELPNSAAEWKVKGNAFYKAGNYTDAARAFSSGLKQDVGADSRIECDIYRNRAVTNILLKRFDPALMDANAAVITTDDQENEETAPLDSKAHFRAGRAAYELRAFEEAKRQFAEALRLTPQDEDSAREMKRTEDRLNEQATGNYDIASISKNVTKRRNRLDHADFLENVEKRDAGAHGKGLFASRDLKTGELILGEKAFAISFDTDPASQDFTLLDSSSQRQMGGTQAYLFFNTIAKMLHNPSRSNELFDLYDGGYSQRTAMHVADGLQVIDAFRAQAVLTYNTYGCPTVKTSSKVAQRQAKTASGYPSTGFWATVSYINHACNGNAMRSFIGDLMMVRATRDIVKGEEILMPYRLPIPENEVAQEELERIWGFRCDCSICVAEAETPTRQRKERTKLLKESSELLSANAISDAKTLNNKKMLQIRNLLDRLEKTYGTQVFERKPRLGLVAPGKWLCQAYASQKNWTALIAASLALLRNLGFVTNVSEKDEAVSIARTDCLSIDDAIVAAIFAAHAFQNLESDGEKEMLSLAESLYEILNGEMNGFEEKVATVKGSGAL